MDTQQKNQSLITKIKIDEQKRVQLLHNFINKNQKELIKDISFDKIKVTIVPSQQQYGDVLGQMIRNGQLVGFPTETVYGLGADATNQNALLQIYRVKRRPLSDPIIVHVLDFEAAKSLVEPQSEKQLELFKKLTEEFWPGPLTVILKANLNILPNVVTASTGFVGLRSPKSEFARLLIQKSNKPIGAPSANLFSHVSPTSAVHVLNDFYDQQITIVDGEKCEFGVESTVVKIVDGKLQILREGSLSTNKLREFVQKQFQENISVEVKKRVQKQEQQENMEAPGQLLKHYAPYLPCFSTSLQNIKGKEQNQGELSFKFNEVAFITFSNKFNELKEKVKFYLSADNLNEFDIVNQQNDEDQKFCTLQEKKKMRSLYFLLRKAENLQVKAIFIGWEQPKQGTLWDKIFRSTQGKTAKLF